MSQTDGGAWQPGCAHVHTPLTPAAPLRLLPPPPAPLQRGTPLRFSRSLNYEEACVFASEMAGLAAHARQGASAVRTWRAAMGAGGGGLVTWWGRAVRAPQTQTPAGHPRHFVRPTDAAPPAYHQGASICNPTRTLPPPAAVVRNADPKDALSFLRLRGRERELICATAAEFLVLVVQRWRPTPPEER